MKIAFPGFEKPLRDEVALLAALHRADPEAWRWAVKLLDEGVDATGRPFFVMPWYPRSLRDWMAAAPPLLARLQVLRRLATAVRAMHATGSSDTRVNLHRDLKPGNVLLTEEGGVVLADLGVSRAVDLARNATNSVAFSRSYAPVEQWLPRVTPLDPSVDVHALAVTVYEVLTGEVPQSIRMLQAALTAKALRLLALQVQEDRSPDEAAEYEQLRRAPLSELVERVEPLTEADVRRLRYALQEQDPASAGEAEGVLVPVLRRCLAIDPDHRESSPLRLSVALARVEEMIGRDAAVVGADTGTAVVLGVGSGAETFRAEGGTFRGEGGTRGEGGGGVEVARAEGGAGGAAVRAEGGSGVARSLREGGDGRTRGALAERRGAGNRGRPWAWVALFLVFVVGTVVLVPVGWLALGWAMPLVGGGPTVQPEGMGRDEARGAPGGGVEEVSPAVSGTNPVEAAGAPVEAVAGPVKAVAMPVVRSASPPVPPPGGVPKIPAGEEPAPAVPELPPAPAPSAPPPVPPREIRPPTVDPDCQTAQVRFRYLTSQDAEIRYGSSRWGVAGTSICLSEGEWPLELSAPGGVRATLSTRVTVISPLPDARFTVVVQSSAGGTCRREGLSGGEVVACSLDVVGGIGG